MTNRDIVRILHESALASSHDFDGSVLKFVDANRRDYDISEFSEFKRDLIEAGSKVRMLFMEYTLSLDSFQQVASEEEGMVLYFFKRNNRLTPALQFVSRGQAVQVQINESDTRVISPSNLTTDSLYTNDKDELVFFVLFPYQSVISEYT